MALAPALQQRFLVCGLRRRTHYILSCLLHQYRRGTSPPRLSSIADTSFSNLRKASQSFQISLEETCWIELLTIGVLE
jgi:hypothetical protein